MGHAFAGYAAGVLVAGLPDKRGVGVRRLAGRILLFAGLACLPDIDLLFGAHSMYTHSVGAVLLVGLAAGLIPGTSVSLMVACAAAYASHLLLDWLGQDTSAPIGIMMLWPFSDQYYSSPVSIMKPVSRRYWLPGFWMHNLKVVLTELVFLGSIAAAAHWLRAHRRRSG